MLEDGLLKFEEAVSYEVVTIEQLSITILDPPLFDEVVVKELDEVDVWRIRCPDRPTDCWLWCRAFSLAFRSVCRTDHIACTLTGLKMWWCFRFSTRKPLQDNLLTSDKDNKSWEKKLVTSAERSWFYASMIGISCIIPLLATQVKRDEKHMRHLVKNVGN